MTDRWAIHKGCGLEYAKRMDDNSIDLIATDPAYASLEKHRKSGTTTRLKNSKMSSNVWFPTLSNEVLLEHMSEWLRILKPGRHLYVFCDPETSYDVVPDMKGMGWRWGNRLVWKKGRIGMGYHYRRSYEDVLFFTKKPSNGIKKRRLRDLGMADVLDKPEYRALKGKGYYPTEKPAALLRDLIRQSAEPSEVVFDPFMGSGSTGEGALDAGCRFVGVDVEDDAIERSRNRLIQVEKRLSTEPPWSKTA